LSEGDGSWWFNAQRVTGKKTKIQKDGGSCVGSNWVERGEEREERSEWQRQDKSEDGDVSILNVSCYVSGSFVKITLIFQRGEGR
jgi:hypothetical protein